MKERTNDPRKNAEAIGLALFCIISLLLIGGKFPDLFGFWYSRVGFTLWLFLPAGGLLIGMILLILLGRIDEKFPSFPELELMVDGFMMLGLLGTVGGLISGFTKLAHASPSGGAADISMTSIVQITSETLFCTGLGLTFSFIAWLTKKKLFPEAVRQRIMASRLQMIEEQEETGDRAVAADPSDDAGEHDGAEDGEGPDELPDEGERDEAGEHRNDKKPVYEGRVKTCGGSSLLWPFKRSAPPLQPERARTT